MKKMKKIDNLLPLLTRVSDIIKVINGESYYIDIWNKVAHKKPLSECSNLELLEPFQNFWEQLPDHTSIRRGPFFEICDLAEEYCCFDSNNEDYD